MTQKYEWIMFDADETLFHFKSFGGLCKTFAKYGIEFSQEDFEAYEIVNKQAWINYQDGKITSVDLKTLRFSSWAKRIGVTPEQLNIEFLASMVEVCTLYDGVLDILEYCQGKYKMAVITNGFMDMQEERLKYHGIEQYFDLLVVSEEVGVAKPNKIIFNYARSQMGNPPRDKILMVGDNVDSDILGGINAGLDTCWFNPRDVSIQRDFSANYQISSMEQLRNII